MCSLYREYCRPIQFVGRKLKGIFIENHSQNIDYFYTQQTSKFSLISCAAFNFFSSAENKVNNINQRHKLIVSNTV